MPTRTPRTDPLPVEPFGLYDVVKSFVNPSLRGEVVGVHVTGKRALYDVKWTSGRGQAETLHVGTTTTAIPHADLRLVKSVLYCNLCEGTGGSHDPKCDRAPLDLAKCDCTPIKSNRRLRAGDVRPAMGHSPYCAGRTSR